MNTQEIEHILRSNADKYETANFIVGDPSWFMHQVGGSKNQEAMAFIASTLSYGSRKQFLPKIDHIRQASQGEVHRWLKERMFRTDFRIDDTRAFYRLYTYGRYAAFLEAYADLIDEYGTIGDMLRQKNTKTGIEAVEQICGYFAKKGVDVIIPKDTTSACKRVCMFLRWMVRTDSPVDIGIWSDFIDKKSLIMPLDTHVMQQSASLELLSCKSASMSAARQLTKNLSVYFPEDPLRGDFALFGYGVNK